MVASTVIMTHKIMKTGVPRNIYAKLVSVFPYQTRQATNGNIRLDGNENFKSESTFRNNARLFYNQIPMEIRQMEITGFKRQVKKWVKSNIPIR